MTLVRTTFALSGLFAAGLLTGCADSFAPDRLGLRLPTPEFAIVPSVAPNGQFNAAGSNVIQKGFNPVNPHRGDAIIATFFWSGSATITSVVDHETNGRPIGNTYNLVESVSAGGITMVTYVAVNIQNFPDGFDERVQAGDSVLVVQANMSGPVTSGGMMITAYSGVQPTLAQALGEHAQASGSSTTQTVADPGTIAVNPGALVYAVTMGNQVVGMDPPPPPFTNVSNQSDGAGTIKGDAERMVQGGSAGTSHPTWVWGFNSSTPRTWLATVLALNEVPTSSNQPPVAAFSSSCSALTCTFTNTSSDPDGSISANSWNLGDGQTSTAASPSHSYAAAGTYNVTLTVTDNQGATNSVVHSVTVSPANQTPTAAFTSSCTNLTCTFTNSSSDPDGSISANSWTFGDGQTSSATSPAHGYAAAGTYTVTLTVTDNQGATSSPTSQTVTVTAPNQPPVASFTKSCTGLTCSFTSTSSDADGSITAYSWTFGDGGTSTLQNPSHTYGAGGTYTVTLTVTDNRGAKNSSSQSVTVTQPNRPPTVNAGPDQIVVLGALYTLNASFSDPDNDGPWSYTIDWGDGSTSTGTMTSQGTISRGHTYLLILTQRTIRVTVRDAHGASGSDTKVITLVL